MAYFATILHDSHHERFLPSSSLPLLFRHLLSKGQLINEGVSLATIRKRLGHQHIQSTLRYAQQSDEVADLEIRAWRRRKRRS